jgi:alkylation response protein AidB-like acyl-CoA dehydrogenase
VTTVAAHTDTQSAGILDQLTEWLHANWSPDLSVAEWWQRLGLAGWAAPYLPPHAYGRGLTGSDTVAVARAIAAHGALGPPAGLGLLIAAPTIAAHGTQAQIDQYVRAIVTGEAAWCQLFSEPGAGSDLAAVQTRAVRDGDEWVVNGQKVWTSGGQYADFGMLIARTDPDVPKHQGITYFAFDMRQPGVEVRPLREMTGQALFNEVFLTDARVPTEAVIGGVNRGWAVANTSLMLERAGLGAGGAGAAGSALPGTVAGHLERRAADLVAGAARTPGGGSTGLGITARQMIELARSTDRASDATVRQDLARLQILEDVARYLSLRAKQAARRGHEIPGVANIAKLLMSETMRVSRDLGLRLLGPRGMLHAYRAEDRAGLDTIVQQPLLGTVTSTALFAQGPSIYGGTDQVQRNILGERVLGLPKEPSNDRTVPFRDLPQNN